MTDRGQRVDHQAVRKGVAVLAALAASAAPSVAHAGPDPTSTSTYRILSNPSGGDDFMFRGAIHQNAQEMSDRLFAALASVLGGNAPQVNFVQQGDELTPTHASATFGTNTINLDPQAVAAFTNSGGSAHDSTVYAMAHEMAHLRQVAAVLSDLAQREGGAQAFTDVVTPVAAYKAHIPVRPGNFDGNYADYVQQANARGRDWILGGQFNRPPANWP